MAWAQNLTDAAERTAIAQFHFGSVAYTRRTARGAAADRAVADAVQAQATLAATRGVRFFVAVNQEGGLIQALSGPGFEVMPSGHGWRLVVVQPPARCIAAARR